MKRRNGQGLVVALALTATCAMGADLARIGAVVLDAETRRPLADVEMKGHFAVDNGWQAWKGAAAPVFVTARTDREGRCTASARTNKGVAGWHVKSVPEGYYLPAHGGWFTFEKKGLLGNWQPDSLVSTVLVQRVGHPVPLVAKVVQADEATPMPVDLIGRAKGRLAYDFLRGDWLPPVGAGETADVEFMRAATADPSRGEVTMRFPGEGNGLVEMPAPDYAVPRIRAAPEDGYGAELAFSWSRDPDRQTVRREHGGRNFCFRIRTRRDASGRLVGGYYGKIYDGVLIAEACGAQAGTTVPMGAPWMGYFLNPSPLDRNLEWDRKTVLVRNPDTGRFEPKPAAGTRYPCRGMSGPEP